MALKWFRPNINDLRAGTESGYVRFQPTGQIMLEGNATVFDDFSVQLNRSRQGALSKPDYDATELGLLFPQDDATEIVMFVIQMQHAKKMGSSICPHVHYIQDEATVPVFKIDYRWYNNGAAVPAEWTTISSADGGGNVHTYSSGSILQVMDLPEITPPDEEAISSNLDIKFYRDDNVVSGDVLAKYIDFHIEYDSMGSDQEYVK